MGLNLLKGCEEAVLDASSFEDLEKFFENKK